MYIGAAIKSSPIALSFVDVTRKLGFHNSFPLGIYPWHSRDIPIFSYPALA
jgi:hypothetical protein